MTQQIPITSPLGDIMFTAELIRREQGNSINKAQSFTMDDEVEGFNMLNYEDVSIMV